MWRNLGMTAAVAVPAVVLRVLGIHLSPEVTVLVYGAGVVASAVLLAWAAEAAQVDISGALAIAILALIAVLPEYAVDLYFAYTAGSNPEYTQFAAANMTGSNRLLIGIGWPVVAFTGMWAIRRRRARAHESGEVHAEPRRRRSLSPRHSPVAVELPGHRRVELAFLAMASIYCFLIPFTRSIAWYDAIVLLAMFGLYLWRVTLESRSEPELIGIAAEIGALPQRPRRLLVSGLFLAAAAIVVAAAEPFANGLVDTGRLLGIDQFLLVQWLAPLSSEAPELIVATIFALRLRAADGLGTLLSAKVNQWTVLVGSLWVAYALGGGGGSLVLDDRQTEEFLLTAAQALLATAVLIDLTMSAWEAGALFVLFALQFPFPQTEVRLVFSGVYLAVAILLFLRHRRALAPVFRSLWRLPRRQRALPAPEAEAE